MKQSYSNNRNAANRNTVSNQDISAALTYIDSSDRETRLKVATALTTEFGKQSAQSYWCDWCELKSTDFTDLAPQAGRYGIGFVYHLARESGYRPDSFSVAPAPQDDSAKHANAATLAARIYSAAQAVTEHAYLNGKHVSATASMRVIDAGAVKKLRNGYDLNSKKGVLTGSLLVIPHRKQGAITTLEFIDSDGRKSLLAGGDKAGAFWIAQAIEAPVRILYCEGVATALSVAMAAPNDFVVSVGSDSGFAGAYAELKATYPLAQHVFCGDKSKSDGKATKQTIRAAAGEIPIALPLALSNGSDFNDLHVNSSIAAVAISIECAKIYAALADNASSEFKAYFKGDVSNFEKSLKELKGDANPLPRAAAIASRQSWRIPNKLTVNGLIARISGAITDCTVEQLEAITRYVESAHATDKERYKRAHTLAADITAATNDEAYRIIDSFGAGTFVVRAGVGTGKTQRIIKPLTDKIQNAIVKIYSTSLIESMHKLLADFVHYQDVATDNSLTPERLLITPNSELKPYAIRAGAAADLLAIDEVHHYFSAILAPAGTMKKQAARIFAAALDAIKAAPLFIGVDADLCDNDVKLMRSSGIDVVVIDVTQQRQQPLSVTITNKTEDISETATTALTNDKKVLIAVSSANTGRKLNAELSKQFPDKKIGFVNAKKGYATNGEPEIIALLKDVNGECVQYDCLIYTPAIETGVSIQIEHFTVHLAIYDGTGSAKNFVQQIGRDRTATDWLIAIAGNGRKATAIKAKDILNERLLAYRLQCELTGNMPDCEVTPFDEWQAIYSATEQRQQQNYAQSLCFALEEIATVTYDRNRGDSFEFKKAQSALAQQLDVDFAEKVSQLAPLSVAEYEKKSTAYRVLTETSELVLAHEICETVGIEHHELTSDAVQLFNDGKLRKQKALFALAVCDNVDSERDRSDVIEGVAISLRSNEAATQAGLKAMQQLSGIDFKTRAGFITTDSALALYDACKNDHAAAGIAETWNMRGKPSKFGAIKWFAAGLRKLGLILDSEGDSASRRYFLQREPDKNAAGKITTPGHDFMLSTLATEKADSSLVNIDNAQLSGSVESAQLSGHSELSANGELSELSGQLSDSVAADLSDSGELSAALAWYFGAAA